MRLLTIFLLLIVCSLRGMAVNTDSLLHVLDDAIKHQNEYDERREARINALKSERRGNGYEAEFNHNLRLVEAYDSYRYNETVALLKRNLALADSAGRQLDADRMRIRLIYAYADASMPLEAMELVRQVDESKLTDDDLGDYYTSCRKVCGEICIYSHDKETRDKYGKLIHKYRDLMLEILPTNDVRYFQEAESKFFDAGKAKLALRENDRWLANVKPDTHEYAIMAYFRSEDYRALGDSLMQEYWLLQSAITDARCATKNQASLWMLAKILAKRGDNDRSYRYVKRAFEDARLFNSPRRLEQTTSALSVIEQTYQKQIEARNTKLIFSLCMMIVLVMMLVALMLQLRKQMKKVKAAHAKEKQANERLSESNRIKEEYIGRFLTLCTSYMKRLDTFRNNALRKAKAGQIAEFLNAEKMRAMKDEDREQLMNEFDKAFLQIFPGFVEQLNALLDSESQIRVESGELLNTELRIFALIRLGIEESSKIAEFLHYSVNTIYNYRARVKKGSIVPKEDFERRVMEIA